MGFIQWMESFFDGSSRQQEHVPTVNPANGLPMIDNSCIDIAGNAFGTDDMSHNQMHSWDDHYHDAFNSNSGFDNGF